MVEGVEEWERVTLFGGDNTGMLMLEQGEAQAEGIISPSISYGTHDRVSCAQKGVKMVAGRYLPLPP